MMIQHLVEIDEPDRAWWCSDVWASSEFLSPCRFSPCSRPSDACRWFLLPPVDERGWIILFIYLLSWRSFFVSSTSIGILKFHNCFIVGFCSWFAITWLNCCKSCRYVSSSSSKFITFIARFHHHINKSSSLATINQHNGPIIIIISIARSYHKLFTGTKIWPM